MSHFLTDFKKCSIPKIDVTNEVIFALIQDTENWILPLFAKDCSFTITKFEV